ncbi:MAG TPA: L-threonine 3-dehydrogenase [Phycisphaeraceae bacterium]|nr:L-threonine 3-dehydrogenase [Phycisphaeraceae bacterium]
MRCLVKTKPAEGMELLDRPVPSIGHNDVLIKISKTGICGTDRHIWEWDAWASGRVPVGTIIGHEFVGHVVEKGSEVTGIEIGDRVSGEGHIGCGQCRLCRTGNMHICNSVRIIGIDRDGCFAEYLSLPARNVWPVHPDIPDKIAAVFDPLGNAVHTVFTGDVSGKTVLITGVGIIGLMAVTVARAAGASRIYVSDVDKRRLDIATRLGAEACFDARDADWPEKVREMTRGEGVDVLLEMSGVAAGIHQGFAALRPGGRAALLGLPGKPIEFDLANEVIFKAATVIGVNGRRMFQTWFQMEELLLSGKLDLEPIITHELPLADFARGFALMQSGEGIKIVLDYHQ